MLPLKFCNAAKAHTWYTHIPTNNNYDDNSNTATVGRTPHRHQTF
jgi:hypothetical protein